MNANRAFYVYWLTFMVCVIGIGEAEVIFAPRDWQDSKLAMLAEFCLCWVLSVLVSHGVIRQFGLSLERRETEVISLPTPLVAPPCATQVVVCSIYTRISTLVVFFTAINCLYMGLMALPIPKDFRSSLYMFFMFVLMSWGMRHWGTRMAYLARVDEEGAGSGGRMKRYIAWCDVTACTIAKRYGIIGQLKECAITLVDEQSHNTVVLSLIDGGQYQADEVMQFVRWKLSRQGGPQEVSGAGI